MPRFPLLCCSICIQVWRYKPYISREDSLQTLYFVCHCFPVKIPWKTPRVTNPILRLPLYCCSIYRKLRGYKPHASFSCKKSYGKHWKLETLCLVFHCCAAVFVYKSKVTNHMFVLIKLILVKESKTHSTFINFTRAWRHLKAMWTPK